MTWRAESALAHIEIYGKRRLGCFPIRNVSYLIEQTVIDGGNVTAAPRAATGRSAPKEQTEGVDATEGEFSNDQPIGTL